MQGIVTSYAGVNFRSRLEARWAATFDIMDWPWNYEPLQLDGWIPDFALTIPGRDILLCEVKPGLSLTQALEQGADKVIRSGYRGAVAVLASRPFGCVVGLATMLPTVRWEELRFSHSIEREWNQAANPTQWQPRYHDPPVIEEQVNWRRNALLFRRSRGDDDEVSRRWSDLVGRIAQHSELHAGLLLGAEEVAIDARQASACFRARSIRGALLRAEERQRCCELAELEGWRLTISVLPDEAFEVTA